MLICGLLLFIVIFRALADTDWPSCFRFRVWTTSLRIAWGRWAPCNFWYNPQALHTGFPLLWRKENPVNIPSLTVCCCFFFLILKYCKGISYFLSRHVHFLPIPSPQGGFVSFTICTSWIRPQSSSSVDGSSLFWFCYDFWWGNFAQRISVLLMNIWRWYHFITVK